MFSFSAFYWNASRGFAGFFPGQGQSTTTNRRIDIPIHPKGYGAMLTIPTGGFNRLEIGYFTTEADGSFRAPRNTRIFAGNVSAGDLLATTYDFQNIRISWNYLTFPVPPTGSKLRIKTFWEFQRTLIKPLLLLPEKQEEPDDPIPSIREDLSINYPGAGIGLEFVPSPRFRFEGRASGMAFPGKSRYIDAEASAVLRLAGRVEVFGGVKAYHFRTSPQADTFMEATPWGPFGGIRYVFPK
jgi:hypothetical protein